jgi:hypothetical protein
MAPHSTATEISSDLAWIETDLDGSKHLSHESVSSLFHTWTTEDCFVSCSLLLQESPASVRQVLEGLEDDMQGAAHILELPPLSQRGPKRPLCTFHFCGTRHGAARSRNADETQQRREDQMMLLDAGGDDADVSLPSLNEEDELFASASSLGIAIDEDEELSFVSSTQYEDLKSSVSLEVPAIDKSLKNDKQLNEYLAKFHRLVAKVRQVEKEIQDEDEQRTKTKKPRLGY